MKYISAALKAFLAQPYQTMCVLWLIQRPDGSVYGFTNHDVNITFDLEAYLVAHTIAVPPGIDGTGSVTYLAASGFTVSDVVTAGDLNVDTTDINGVLISPSITEDDLNAGLWDNATICEYQVNWRDLTMGPLFERYGNLGQVTIDRGFFRAEQRGILQKYTRTLGRLDSPMCDADLGDSRCTVDLGPLTVTGTISAVNADQVTLYDPARTEPGPTGGVNVVDISNANPCVVTVDATTGLSNFIGIVISGVVGPDLLNTQTVVRNLDTGASTFELAIDTSDTAIYPPYVSGGTVTPLGSSNGYFDYGRCTMTSGLNNGLSMDVKSYVPGQWVLQLPFPYVVAPGDTYSMTPGCNKLATSDCKTKFNNIVNFRGFPYKPGLDKIVQVGRHT